jgi:hypothetical protein
MLEGVGPHRCCVAFRLLVYGGGDGVGVGGAAAAAAAAAALSA